MTDLPHSTNHLEVADLSELIRRLRPLIRLLSVGVMSPSEKLATFPLPILVNPTDFEQVLLGLVFNAKEAVSDHGTLAIETDRCAIPGDGSAEGLGLAAGEYAELRVVDSGAGMTEEVQSHLFEAAFTTKGERTGHGMPLPAIQQVVQGWGGAVGVVTKKGTGTTIRILLPQSTLPLAEPDGEVVPPTTETFASARVVSVGEGGAPDPPPQGTILLVDDDAALRGVVRRMLELSGFRVLAADGVAQVRSVLADHSGPLDLLLTDVMLPGGDGGVIAAVVRREYPATPVLFMSGYEESVVREHGVADVGVSFLEKPFSREELLGRISALLRPA